MPWLEIPDGRMYFEAAGTGEPGLLFAHGSACTHADWHFVLPELADRHSVASVDLRGYGASTAPAETCTIDTFAADLVRLVQHLGWSRAVLIGHSMSCRAVLQAAVDHPEIVVGVVIVDTTVMPRSLEEVKRQLAAGNADDDPAGRRARFVEMLGDGVAPAERDRVLDHMSRVPCAVTETVTMSAYSWDAQRLGQTAELLDSPVLAIQTTVLDGAVRRNIQPGESTPGLDVLQTARSGVEMVVLPGLGHFPMLEKPIEVASQIAEFAGRHYRNGSSPRSADASVETAARPRLLNTGE
jgi:pimeloyl-ACP methyl ester carboxylesterase